MFSRDAAKKLISIVLYISEPAARAVRELKKGGPETQREEMSVSFVCWRLANVSPWNENSIPLQQFCFLDNTPRPM